MPVQIAHGTRAAVVSGHPLATQVAIDELRRSGNIVDAALAGAATLCVALPHACGLGGDCFILVHHSGQTFALNGSGLSPARLPADASKAQLASGPLSCAVPGMLGAWDSLHRKFGQRPWHELLKPAVDLAHAGVEPATDLAKALVACRAGLDADDGCRALFPNTLGDNRLIQPALASSLAEIAKSGSRALYDGPLGESLCRASAARGGVLHMDDLRTYQPIWSEPLAIDYRGFEVRVCPPNSFGLLMLLQLGALSGISLKGTGIESAERLHHMMAATSAALQVGTPLICDPRVAGDGAANALSSDALKELRALMTEVPETPSLPRSHGTAVISVADADGNGVTIVQSIFTPFGSMVADKNTGIVLNNRLLGFSTDPSSPNAAAPSKRPAHTLSPSMTFKDGRLKMLLSTPGGTGQTITLTQVLTNVVDFSLSIDQSVDRPRWSMDIDGNFVVEPEIADATVEMLNASGFAVRKATPAQRFFFGSAECIDIAPDRFTAVADHRRDAFAAAI